MRTYRPLTIATTLSLAAAALCAGYLGSLVEADGGARGRADARGNEGGVATVGPDVIVGALTDVAKYGTVGGISAYAIGTTSCNIGDALLSWIDSGANDSMHPVIAQNLYRLKDGRFEQVGQSWPKHGWCAVDGNLCGTCQSDGSCEFLGIGCSDPYSASLNGVQSDLGPRSQVNPATGAFPFPFTAPTPQATIGRRLQVQIDDLTPASNPGALYFAEGQYIQPEDAAAGNDDNNASYRRATVGALSGGAYVISLTGATAQQLPAIYAWKNNGLGVGVPDPNVTVEVVDVPGDGRFLVASKVTDLGDGQFHYEYAIQNLNSARAGQAFSVPIGAGTTITKQGFHASFSHSGEPYSNAAWSMTAADGVAAWATQTYAESANANALRWGTLDNFRFDATTPPTTGTATLTLFAPGEPTAMTVNVPVPSAAQPNADLSGDGVVDAVDLGLVLGAWGTPDADLDGDGTTDGADLAIVLAAWH
ncbi:MAG: hypothetical protein U0572_02315 [Phycisphaerales bacterium]